MANKIEKVQKGRPILTKQVNQHIEQTNKNTQILDNNSVNTGKQIIPGEDFYRNEPFMAKITSSGLVEISGDFALHEFEPVIEKTGVSNPILSGYPNDIGGSNPSHTYLAREINHQQTPSGTYVIMRPFEKTNGEIEYYFEKQDKFVNIAEATSDWESGTGTGIPSWDHVSGTDKATGASVVVYLPKPTKFRPHVYSGDLFTYQKMVVDTDSGTDEFSYDSDPTYIFADGEHIVYPQSPASVTDISGASESIETAFTDTYTNVASFNSGVQIPVHTRSVYNPAGDEILYGYQRILTFDYLGRLYSVGAETRYTIATPQPCSGT